MKYVLVSGGVISGIGKGIIASSTGLLLKTMGLRSSYCKIDPYLNVDAGTMNPNEHGEVFVLEDDLNITLTRDHNITTGKIYQHVIQRERKGDYLGKTVQVVPHLTDAVQDWIERVAKIPVDDGKHSPDVCIIELGGTVGDIESGPFVESMRQLRRRANSGGKNNFLQISEFKTKPTQQAIRDVRSAGLSPDLIACRCSMPLDKPTVDKIALYCQVEPEQVIAVHDVDSTYHVPMLLEQQGLKELLTKILRLDAMTVTPQLQARGASIWSDWKALTGTKDQHYEEVSIVMVQKYAQHDAFLSVCKSLEHACMRVRRKLKLTWLNASHLEEETKEKSPVEYHKAWHEVCTAHGVLVPGAFGTRGASGMIAAAHWARTQGIPFLGICFGFQVACIEFARNVCGVPAATSSEFDPRAIDPVIVPMEDIDQEYLGGTMRLGRHPTLFQPDTEWSKLRTLYDGARLPKDDQPSDADASEAPLSPQSSRSQDSGIIYERHRHRYEVNPTWVERLTGQGLQFIGKDDKALRMEIFELQGHKFYAGVQYHPEYVSKVLRPSPVYLGFVAASSGCLEEVLGQARGQHSHLVNGNQPAGRQGSISQLVNGVDDVHL